MSRHEMIKMFELLMRMLFIIYFQIKKSDKVDVHSLYLSLFEDYRNFMESLEFSRR